MKFKEGHKPLLALFTMEQWKDILGFEGLYQVSNHGRVRNSAMTILKTQYQNSGYLVCHLSKHRKRKACTVHRLVATAFIPNPENKAFVNHLDGNKSNNCSSNLEWCSPQENAQHAVRTGLFKTYERTEEHRKATGERSHLLFAGKPKSRTHVEKIAAKLKGTKHPNVVRKDKVKVMCVETQQVFDSIKKAAEYEGCNRNLMWYHLHSENHKSKSIKHTYIITQHGSAKRSVQ